MCRRRGGCEIATEYFDATGKIMTVPTEGIAGWTAKFDAQGNANELHYHGVDYKPLSNDSGIAGWRAKYDHRGSQTDLEYLDEQSQPQPALRRWDATRKEGGGYARVVKTFDARNRTVEEQYFGVDGRPVRHPDGWSRRVDKYPPLR